MGLLCGDGVHRLAQGRRRGCCTDGHAWFFVAAVHTLCAAPLAEFAPALGAAPSAVPPRRRRRRNWSRARPRRRLVAQKRSCAAAGRRRRRRRRPAKQVKIQPERSSRRWRTSKDSSRARAARPQAVDLQRAPSGTESRMRLLTALLLAPSRPTRHRRRRCRRRTAPTHRDPPSRRRADAARAAAVARASGDAPPRRAQAPPRASHWTDNTTLTSCERADTTTERRPSS